jgi:small subunit ribosomal protein S15Ae
LGSYKRTTFFILFSPPLLSPSPNPLTNTPPHSGYIGEFDLIDDHRSGKIVVQLNGRLNKTGVISPRFNVQVTQIESWVNLLLPSRGFGIIILTTSSGILDHEEARRKNVGGKLLGYVY